MNSPLPERAVLTVRSLLLVNCLPASTLTVAMLCVPFKAWLLVVKVAVPVMETEPLVCVMPPLKTMTALAPLIVPPFTVTKPVIVLLFVAPVRERVPPETSVVPLTVNAPVEVVNPVPPETTRLAVV